MVAKPRTYGVAIESIDTPDDGIEYDDSKYHAPYLDVSLRTLIEDDEGRALFGQAFEEGEDVRMIISSRSGWARFGVELDANLIDIEELDSRIIEIQARIYALSKEARASFLSVLAEEVHTGQLVNAGSLILLPQSARMTKEEIAQAIKEKKILLPDGAVLTEDGRVLIPIGPVHYETDRNRRILRDEVRRVLVEGKHALDGIQSPKPGYPDGQKDFVIGGISVSLGSKMGVLLQDVLTLKDDGEEQPTNFEQLSSVRLDEYRTTGFTDLTDSDPNFDCVRQLELRKTHGEDDGENDLGKAYVQMEMYHTGPERLPITERVNREGLSLFDSSLIRDPELLGSVMSQLSIDSDFKDIGMFIGPGRAVSVPYIKDKQQQDAEIRNTALPTFRADSDPDANILLRGNALSPAVRTLAEEVLVDIGGSQRASKMYATPQFRLDMHEMYSDGIGIFVSNGLQHKNGSGKDGEDSRQYFTGTEHHEFRQLADRGALICKHTMDPDKNEPHLEVFKNGFWIDPDLLERFQKISTYIAMYGTHKDEFMGPLLERGNLPNFMDRMNKLFDGEGGIIHGKGVGFMGAVSVAAKESGMWQSAVGINAGAKGQGSSYGQEASVVFAAEDRLDRQKMMDDMATFKIFGIGGGGTLEEAAITICSQKLFNQVPTPLIFVDFMQEYRGDTDHLWEDLRKLVGRFAAGQTLTSPDGSSGKLPEGQDSGKLLSLIDAWVPHNIKLVDRFGADEQSIREEDNLSAATIIEQFHANPQHYWKQIGVLPSNWGQYDELDDSGRLLINKLQMSYDSMQETFAERGISFPQWLSQHNPEEVLGA
ncbi:MAG: LOG family protein [bacterium]|nr:LOG family protein [bacterium]MDA1292454.1 LOG family protein [bacterium]